MAAFRTQLGMAQPTKGSFMKIIVSGLKFAPDMGTTSGGECRNIAALDDISLAPAASQPTE